MSVGPSVRKIYVHYNSRTGKDNRVFEFCLKGVRWESKLPKFRPECTKLESNEIFNDFAISREPFDEIDSNFILKIWTSK